MCIAQKTYTQIFYNSLWSQPGEGVQSSIDFLEQGFRSPNEPPLQPNMASAGSCSRLGCSID